MLQTKQSRLLLVLAILLAASSYAFSAIEEWPNGKQIFVYVPNSVPANDPRSASLHFDFLDVGYVSTRPEVYCSSQLLNWPNRPENKAIASGYGGFEYCARRETSAEHFNAKYEVFERFVEERIAQQNSQKIEVLVIATLRWLGAFSLVVGIIAVVRWIHAGKPNS